MKELLLQLDDLDYKVVIRCIAIREGFRIMPEGKSDLNGAAIAEICRGWEEMLNMTNEDKDPPVAG